MKRSPSVKDVATTAGVSVGTVSNVLNHPDRVGVATRQKVEAVMATLGYVRNESARQLRAGTSRVLAYVVLETGNPFFTDVAAGIDDAAAEQQAPVFLCNSAHSIERETAYLDHLRQQRVQGIMITPVDPMSPMLTTVADQGVPVVIVDRIRDDDAFCTVSVDDVLGGRLALEHLLDQGHDRIAFIGGPLDLGQVADRRRGATEALRDAGRSIDDLLVLETAGLTADDGRDAGNRLVGLPTSQRPTAAFCANDLVAIGLLQQITAAGRRVPDDLAIIGYDDIEFAAAAAVPLSSIRQPRLELGRTAARLVLDEATNDAHAHEHVVFTPVLVARTSTLG